MILNKIERIIKICVVVHGCAWVCADMRGYAWVCVGIRKSNVMFKYFIGNRLNEKIKAPDY